MLRNRKRPVSILSGDLSGIIKPSRMTLLLGPPGSGKTTFLLALAGKLDSSLKVSGRVSYNGHDMDEFVPQRSSAYISQDDVHIGQLTVRETLAFSARCQGIGTRYGKLSFRSFPFISFKPFPFVIFSFKNITSTMVVEMLMELSRREREAKIQPDPDIDLYMKATALKGQEGLVTDYILKVIQNYLYGIRILFFFVVSELTINIAQILGLEICADIMVGDQMTRGISGGQKKRVTTGKFSTYG